VNLTGHFICTQEFGRKMIEQRVMGRIINVASNAALDGGVVRYLAAYNSSKGGTIALTKTVALEFAPYGITVNAICPGVVDTPMTHYIYEDPVRTREMTKFVPLGRIGKPEDIAAGALFLASGLAAYITGHVLVIDGGWTVGQVPNEILGM
jgi:NAD(P)-dependent dehydrogenase (short-subunit alcohol dehydrogenase family)